MFDYELEHILSFVGKGGGTPEAIGALPDGLRVNFQNVGGEVTGPRIRGKVRPSGGDWVTVRKDGVAILDARITLETDDHALILVTYPALSTSAPMATSDSNEVSCRRWRESEARRGFLPATPSTCG